MLSLAHQIGPNWATGVFCTILETLEESLTLSDRNNMKDRSANNIPIQYILYEYHIDYIIYIVYTYVFNYEKIKV